MNMSSNEFKQYVWFSVQVDQYYAAVRIYARHHESLKQVYRTVPKHANWPEGLGSGIIPESVENFLMITALTFNYMGTTGIFSDAPYAELKDLPTDMVNFGFYTCFSFQWTLFENFVKKSVIGLVDDKLLPKDISKQLRRKEMATAQFLAYINEGHVFGSSPFSTVLPVAGWMPETEVCGYEELNRIREMRNHFVHAIENRQILPNTEIEKERFYDRSMWIMRKFAENVDFEVQQLRNRAIGSHTS